MENRKRNVQIIVRVTEDKRTLIEEKMRQIPTMNLSAYSRKMLIDGYIIVLDLQKIKAHTAQLQKIGGNLNQITKRINETGRIYEGLGSSKMQRRQRGILRSRLSCSYACYETVNTNFKGKDGK